jgi:hypothetical protein
MIPSARYALAFAINVALPTLAYRVTLPHFGLVGALIASSMPLLAWMTIDLLRFRHFDALSAMVLASIAMSLLILASRPGQPLREARDPLTGGITGVLFLLSLLLKRPLVFWLARSTLSREHQGREYAFEEAWQTRPDLVKSIRLMTAVWGLGLVGENAARLWVTSVVAGDQAEQLSTYIRYAVYGGLLVWTMAYRHWYIKRRAP